jgi:hypothetical protein
VSFRKNKDRAAVALKSEYTAALVINPAAAKDNGEVRVECAIGEG